MTEKATSPTPPARPIVNPPTDVLGGETARGETTAHG